MQSQSSSPQKSAEEWNPCTAGVNNSLGKNIPSVKAALLPCKLTSPKTGAEGSEERILHTTSTMNSCVLWGSSCLCWRCQQILTPIKQYFSPWRGSFNCQGGSGEELTWKSAKSPQSPSSPGMGQNKGESGDTISPGAEFLKYEIFSSKHLTEQRHQVSSLSLGLQVI